MRSLIALIVISLCAGTAAEAQKQKKKERRRVHKPPPPAAAATPTRPRIIGSTVVIITRTAIASQAKCRPDRLQPAFESRHLESTIALDTIASLAFGGAATPSRGVDQPVGPVRADFAREQKPPRFFQTLVRA